VVPHDALAYLVLAWRHPHLLYQSKSRQKAYHQRERDFCLACAEGLLGDAFAPLKTWVFDKLDSIVRASSLVEMVTALIRPYLNSCKGQITQETFHLIMFYHNHRRYKSGKRQGKAPIALLTGKPLEAPWWELFLQQVQAAQGVTQTALPARPPLRLVPHTDGQAHQPAMTPSQAVVDPTDASETHRRQPDSEAA
jgi:hypothetical protein